MPLDFSALKEAPRLLIEAKLKPLQGTRFQPTGFPNLGAATYKGPDGTDMLLVESAQSVANNLEAYSRTNGQPICWDPGANDWVPCLRGIPYVRVVDAQGNFLTNSILESHRLNSSYILDASAANGAQSFLDLVAEHAKTHSVHDPRNAQKLARFLFRYCPNSLLHGVFFANKTHKDKVGNGRLRQPRVLTGFIEASEFSVASSGGARIDTIDPSGDAGGSAETGYGNVLFARDEYASPSITAYFNLDIAQIRGFGLEREAADFLIAFALYKVQRFLAVGLRLRTFCDFDCTNLVVERPRDYQIPSLGDLEKELPFLIKAVGDKSLFRDLASPSPDGMAKPEGNMNDARVTVVMWNKVAAKKPSLAERSKSSADDVESNSPEDPE